MRPLKGAGILHAMHIGSVLDSATVWIWKMHQRINVQTFVTLVHTDPVNLLVLSGLVTHGIMRVRKTETKPFVLSLCSSILHCFCSKLTWNSVCIHLVSFMSTQFRFSFYLCEPQWTVQWCVSCGFTSQLFLCGVCMFSPWLCGFSPGSFLPQSKNKQALRWRLQIVWSE